MRARPILLLTVLCLSSYLASAQSLHMDAVPDQTAVAGQPFILGLNAAGGAPPYSWQLQNGQVPPGCKLNAQTGRISGVPTTAGDYHVAIAVRDSNTPRIQVQRELTIHVIEGLSIDWKEPPAIHGNTISGSAIVSNQTAHSMALTVIVVAVIEIGRATTLGYQHFTIAAAAKSAVIPFGASPGKGTYYVRADASAHQAGRGHVFRASKQTAGNMTLAQF